MTQASISRGRRMSTARCYLDPARTRANLTIETDALAESLMLEGTRCVGVRYCVRGLKREARAAREVIVSAGSIASPQLLELSGIGQGERLKGLGIEVRHDLAGVGENLRDHYAPRMKWRVGRHGVTFNERARGIGALWQGLLYIGARKGFLSLPASPLRAFFKTREGLDSPDAMFTVQPFLVTPDLKLARETGMTIITHQLRPESKGSIHVTAADAAKPPSIRFNFLAERSDRDCVLACMRTVRRLVEAPPLAWLGAEEFQPGPQVEIGRRAARLRHPHGRDHLPPGRDLQDGQRPGRRRRRPPARARDFRPARRRRLDHADADLRQHQRALHHDRREGGADGAGGSRLIFPQRSARKNSTISCASASGCSSAAKWPPFFITLQRRMSV